LRDPRINFGQVSEYSFPNRLGIDTHIVQGVEDIVDVSLGAVSNFDLILETAAIGGGFVLLLWTAKTIKEVSS
jgi:hypothetical protein